MKTKILLAFLLISRFSFAHEDFYKAIELSNVHIKIMVGYENSFQLKIIESYAPAINNYIKSIDPNQKVFVQFNEDYCFQNKNHYSLSFGKFKDFVVPNGFPFSYPYNMGFIDKEEGVNVIIDQKDFKLEPVFKLIQFGLELKDYINNKPASITKQSVSDYVIESIFKRSLSDCGRKYLSQKFYWNQPPTVLNEMNLKVYMQNDSIYFTNNKDEKLLQLATIYSLKPEVSTHCLFVFDTNKSFYFFNANSTTNKKLYDLKFSTNCISDVQITYSKDKTNYQLTKISTIVEGMKSDVWSYFDESRGVRFSKMDSQIKK